MNEQAESQTTEIPKKEHAEPIGLRVLGVHDPRTMTEEQFNSDPYLYGVIKGFRFTPTSERLAKIEEEYKKYLEAVLKLEYIDLRVLLRTAHHKLNNFNPSTSPLWSDVFREFIQAQGYDGIVYNESGDAEHFESTPSYVFATTEKISTYQGWQQKK